MRILHAVFTHHFFGSEHHCAQLARLQAEAGHDVRVLLKNGNPDQLRRFREVVGSERVLVIRAGWPSFFDKLQVGRIIKRFGPDIVHAHLGRAAQRAGAAARRHGVAQVASLHLGYAADKYGRCDGLLCVAGWQATTLAGFTGAVAVLRNWIPHRETTTAMAGLAQDRVSAPIRIGSVGRLDRQKGYDILVPAFRQAFPANGPGAGDVRLVIVGDGPERQHLQALAGQDARIEMVGYQSDVATWLDRFDAFVSSSRFEGLALVVLEAMAAGLPLLLTDVAGNAELNDTQALGQRAGRPATRMTMAPPEDQAGMAGALCTLVGRVKDLRAQGLARVPYDKTELDEATVARRVDGFYQDVLQRRQMARPPRT